MLFASQDPVLAPVGQYRYRIAGAREQLPVRQYRYWIACACQQLCVVGQYRHWIAGARNQLITGTEIAKADRTYQHQQH